MVPGGGGRGGGREAVRPHIACSLKVFESLFQGKDHTINEREEEQRGER